MSGKAMKKKKSVTKFRKAPQAPKRGKSAFILFSIAKHPEMRKTLDDGSTEKAPSVARRVSEAWRNLSVEERAIWEARAHDDKMRYEAEKSAYTGPWKLPLGPKRAKKDPNAPKRPMSAFLAYSKCMRRQVKRDNPDMSNIQVSKVLANMWKAAPDHERSVYIDQEAKERAVYKVAMHEWRTAHEAEMAAERNRRETIARDAIARSNTHAMSTTASSYQPTAVSHYAETLAPTEDVSFANATHAFALGDSGSYSFNPSLNKARNFGPLDSQNQFPNDARSEKIVGYSPFTSSTGTMTDTSRASPSELHHASHRPLGIPLPENNTMQYHMQAERGQHHASPVANMGGYFDGTANVDRDYGGYYWPASNRNVGYSPYSSTYKYTQHSTSSASQSQFGFPEEQAHSSYSQSFPGSVQQRTSVNCTQDTSHAQLYYHHQMDPYRVQQDVGPQGSHHHLGLQEGSSESAAGATSPFRTNSTSQPFVSNGAKFSSDRDGYNRGF